MKIYVEITEYRSEIVCIDAVDEQDAIDTTMELYDKGAVNMNDTTSIFDVEYDIPSSKVFTPATDLRVYKSNRL